jgi:hypothetical protein
MKYVAGNRPLAQTFGRLSMSPGLMNLLCAPYETIGTILKLLVEPFGILTHGCSFLAIEDYFIAANVSRNNMIIITLPCEAPCKG